MLEVLGLVLALLAFFGWIPRLEKWLARVVEAYPRYTAPDAFLRLPDRPFAYLAIFLVLCTLVPSAFVAVWIFTGSDAPVWLRVPICAFAALCVWMLTVAAIAIVVRLFVFVLRLAGWILRLLSLPPSGALASVGLILAVLSAWERFG